MEETLIKDYYTQCVRQEWRRLARDAYHKLEFETTMRFLTQYLPLQGLVLDAGGGPGRYTLALARKGYDMALADITPANLEFARRQVKRAGLRSRVKDYVPASIADLSQFADDSFNAVLCLGGPLSHVLDGDEREKAVSELVRVARRGAPIFVSVMSRLCVLATTLIASPYELDLPHFERLRDTGDYLGGHGFTACHFFLPEELHRVFTRDGLTILETVGLEGVAANHRKALNQVARDEARWQKWLETHFRTCTHPSVVGMSEHMLIVCRKD